MPQRRGVIEHQFAAAATATVRRTVDEGDALLGRDDRPLMALTPLLPAARLSLGNRLPLRLGVRMLGTRWTRGIAGCQLSHLLAQRLNLLLEISDPLLVTSDELFDKITSRLSFRRQFDPAL